MLQLETLSPCALVAQERLMQRDSNVDEAKTGRAIFALVTIAGELHALNGSPLHERFDRLWEAEEERSGERDRFSEIVTEELFSVGFTFFPASAQELVERIASRIEREACSLAA
jgi:hypothetical protein